MGGQLRIASSGAIVGWDMAAGLTLAKALGIDLLLAAETLPVIEAAAVHGVNQMLLEMDNG